MQILAYTGTHECDVFDRSEKVRKVAKHDFWTYWNLLGEFVAKTHFVIRAVNFCQLMQILAYIGPHGCNVFDRNEKYQKSPKHDFCKYWSELSALVAKTHFVIRAVNFCQLMPILAYIGTHGCDVFDRNEKDQKSPKHAFCTYWSVLGALVEKTHFVIHATNFCQVMQILAYIGTHGCDVFGWNEKDQKAPKHDFCTYWSEFSALVEKTHFVIRAANFCQLMPILAFIGTHGCDIFGWNEKDQKAPKHDFCTYWSVLGALVEKSHFVIRAANLCQLMPILAYIGTHGCDVFDRNQKVQKAPKHDFWTYWSVLGALVERTHFVIRAANFCQLMPILAHTDAMFLTGMKKIRKPQNMIFVHIGVYWVRSWKKLTS
jgi:hypothetical protein